MDEARAAGLKVAVCSAATKSSVVFTLKSLLGEQRFNSLDCFLAGTGGQEASMLCQELTSLVALCLDAGGHRVARWSCCPVLACFKAAGQHPCCKAALLGFGSDKTPGCYLQ